MKKMLTMLLLSIFCFSCAVNLATTVNLNDYLLMGIETNNKDNISFKYISEVENGKIVPYTKGKQKLVVGNPGYNHTEASTFGFMIKEYINNKFVNISDTGNVTIKITLKDFWLELYPTESGGMQALKIIGGVSPDYMCVVKLRALIEINNNNENNSKFISATSEGIFSQLSGSEKSFPIFFAKNIDKANNKLVMMINSYLEEMEL